MRNSRASSMALALSLCCSVAGWVGVARAEPPQNATPAEDGIEAFVQRGIELRRTGHEVEALTVFEDALARAPASTRVKVHLAATHQALGQWVEAERYLNEVLREPDDPYIRRHRAILDKAYAFIAPRVGSLDVVGAPDGAELVLSGRSIGTAPLPTPVRVPIGSYVLEVRKEGYYSVSRPIAIGGGSLLRESVTLGQRTGTAPPWMAAGVAPASQSEGARGSPAWLTWTLGGAGVAAAAVSAISFGIREKHASRWNAPGCLQPSLTRGQVCGDELEGGRSAERWGIGAGILSGVLLGGATASFLLERRPPKEAPGLAFEGCGLDGPSAQCFGSF